MEGWTLKGLCNVGGPLGGLPQRGSSTGLSFVQMCATTHLVGLRLAALRGMARVESAVLDLLKLCCLFLT
jgi:hypothetical protein